MPARAAGTAGGGGPRPVGGPEAPVSLDPDALPVGLRYLGGVLSPSLMPPVLEPSPLGDHRPASLDQAGTTGAPIPGVTTDAGGTSSAGAESSAGER